MDVDILIELKDKKSWIKWDHNARTEHYCLFSKSGFSKRLHDVAEDEDILLFTLDNL